MATAKKNSYISADLDFAEAQLAMWHKELQNNPYDRVKDRKELQQTKTGGAYYTVVQTREQIQKALRDTLKEYLAMLEVVERLREKDEAKQAAAKGDTDIPYAMRQK